MAAFYIPFCLRAVDTFLNIRLALLWWPHHADTVIKRCCPSICVTVLRLRNTCWRHEAFPLGSVLANEFQVFRMTTAVLRCMLQEITINCWQIQVCGKWVFRMFVYQNAENCTIGKKKCVSKTLRKEQFFLSCSLTYCIKLNSKLIVNKKPWWWFFLLLFLINFSISWWLSHDWPRSWSFNVHSFQILLYFISFFIFIAD